VEGQNKSITFDGREIRLTTGLYAPQASGSVMIECGDTSLLVTATKTAKKEPSDFLPLICDYEEKLYAAGRIPGGFMRREGRPPERATLIARLIDRPMRPLFPTWMRDEIQIVASCLSLDERVPADVLAVTGASIATLVGEIPFYGPMAAVRVGLIGDDFILNPSYREIEKGDLDIVVAGSPDGIVMIEAGANQLSEQDTIEAIDFGYEAVTELIKSQEDLLQDLGIKQIKPSNPEEDKTLSSYLEKNCTKGIELVLKKFDQSKDERDLELEKIKIDEKLNNLQGENIEAQEKLLNNRQQSEAKLNVLLENWNNLREEMEELSILMKEEDKLTKQIKDKSNSEIEHDLDYLAKLEEELSEIENEIQKVEDNFNKIKKNRNFPFKYQVEPDDIADVISKITGIPISKVVSNERKKLVNLETELSEKVIGQEKAIEAVSAAIRRARVGMKSPKRPVGSFLFMGPTGVGKTELAKSLATVLFDEEDALLRLDMSEYMEKNAVARLLGAPPGYVGYEEGGQLTEAVRSKPYSVILLDEIEKAHAEVFNILLQVLDEGRLTDSQGRTVDFKNTVIIMTSNLAGKSILEYSQKISKSEGKLEKDQQTLDDSISNALSSIFSPEFLNRIDEVVKFDPLSIDELQKIIILQTEDLKNLLLEQKINIAIDKKVINKIANDSYEPEYGARPLSRELRRQIENPLAAKLLEDNFKNKKNITIKLNPAKKDEIVFKPS